MVMGLRNQCGINNYRYNGNILHATSANGPFSHFTVDDSFGPSTPPAWDGTEVEDPNVVDLPGQQGSLLYYCGAWVKNDTALNCTDHDQPQPDSQRLANAQRIGMAHRAAGSKEWVRLPAPVLTVRPSKWDSMRISNPAGLVFPNGSVILAYRANGAMNGIGIARADHWRGPYAAVLDRPLFWKSSLAYAEDPTLYLDANDTIHLLAHGEMSPPHLFKVGVHAVSHDGLHWSEPLPAYTLAANWSEALPSPHPELGRREAPQVLLSKDGQRRPVALFNAAMPCRCHYGSHNPNCNWGDSCRSFSMVCRWVD